MNYFKPVFIFGAIALFATQSIAALDPIGQSVSPAQLPTTVKIGDSLAATYTLTNNKKHPVRITISYATVGDGTTTNDQCNNQVLAPKSHCSIAIDFNPTTAGPLSWQGSMLYDFNQVPLRGLRSTVEGNSGPVSGNTELDLPVVTYVGDGPYNFTLQFKNNGASAVTGNGTVNPSGLPITVVTNGCANKTLTASGTGDDTCTIQGIFSPTETGSFTAQGTFQYTAGSSYRATTSTSTTVQLPGPIEGSSSLKLPSLSTLNVTYPFNFIFQNNGSGPVTGTQLVTSTMSTLTYDNGCLNKTIAPSGYCLITGTFTPTSTGAASINAQFNYVGINAPAMTSTETTVSSTPPPSEGIVSQLIQQLPPNAAIGTNYPIWFQFTNTGTTPIPYTKITSFPTDGSWTLNSDNCTGPSLGASATCNIEGTFNTSSSYTAYTLSAQLSPAAAISTETLSMTTAQSGFFVGVYPLSLRVSAGAVSRPYQFHYQLVNNSHTTAVPITLSFQTPVEVTLLQTATGFVSSIANTNNTWFQCTYNGGPTPTPVFFNPNVPQLITLPGAVGSVCDVYVVFEATTATPRYQFMKDFSMTMSTTLSPTTPPVVTPISFASGAALINNTGTAVQRVITFKNKCSYPVYYALYRSSVIAKNPPSNAPNPDICTTNADCFSGSECVLYDDVLQLKQCEWILPLTPGSYSLPATTGSVDVTIPVYDNAMANGGVRDLAWGGNLAGRVGCTDSIVPPQTTPYCTVNNCGYVPSSPGSQTGTIAQCTTGIGSTNAPISATEFTFASDDPLVNSADGGNLAVDQYNIQLIDGVTVPYSMKPNPLPTYNPATPYSCSAAGISTDQGSEVGTTLGRCSWTFTQPPTPGNTNNYRWITYSASPTLCPTGTECSVPGEVCGLMAASISTPHLKKACGTPMDVTLGITQPMYWTADAVCKVDSTYNIAPFLCSTALPNNTSFTYTNLYHCAPKQPSGALDSCYTAGNTSSNCCGCVNWNEAPYSFIIPTPTGNDVCGTTPRTTNPDWTSSTTGVEPQVSWVKAGCPSAYSYPYDDPSSSFTCLQNTTLHTPEATYNGDVNVVNYDVEFCP